MTASPPARTAARGRARELAVNLALAVSTSVAHLGEDPLLLVVQTARRLPRRLVVAASKALRATGRRRGLAAAIGLWLDGNDTGAAAVLDGRQRSLGTGFRARLGAELAVQVGRPELVRALHDAPPPRVLARAAWLRGDMSAALTHLSPQDGLAVRYRAELRTMEPGLRLSPGAVHRPAPSASPVARTAGHPTTPDAPRALHVLINSLPHTQSGYTVRSHAVLTAQQAAGVSVAAVTRLGYPVSIGALGARHHDVVDGVLYHRLLSPRMPATTMQRLDRQAAALLPLVRQVSPTVLHTTTHYVNALVTEALARSTGLPWVYEVRGLLEESWVARRPTDVEQEHAASSERYEALRAKETELTRAADHVVTLSSTLRDELVGRGVDPARITVVPNAVDPRLLAPTTAAADARDVVGLAREGFWVGTVSSLVDYEGLETLLGAVAVLRAEGVDARGCIVGDGVSRPSLERHAARLGLADHVTFTGRVPRALAVTYHRALDVFAVPRRDVRVCRLVTPLKPVEAMACGRPVVASDLPALREIVADPGTGVVAPAGDVAAWAAALGGLATDPARRERLGAVGREFAAGRSWPAAALTYRAIYERLGAA